MKYISFIRPDGQSSIGKVIEDAVIELVSADGSLTDLKSSLETNTLAQLNEAEHYSLADINLLPVIPKPDKIFCIGLNYADHVLENNRSLGAEYPVIFTRFANTLLAHGKPILQPKLSTQLDYEGELALVIGKGGRYISKDDAFEHIAGFSCFNDASIRDWQRHASHYTPGKNFPSTGGFGPYLVTQDEIGDIRECHVTTRLNDQIVQDQAVSDLIFSIPFLINYISSFTTLNAGDVIATGTPGGVGHARTPQLWMKPGDTVTVSIDKVGTLIHSIEKE